jgi:hypothetical protein
MKRMVLPDSLNFKGIPFGTESNIQMSRPFASESVLCQRSNERMEHRYIPSRYTLPIYWASSDSPCLAEYLDETYPNTPKLFPQGTRALPVQYAFIDEFAVPVSNATLNPRSEEYKTCEREVGYRD